METGQELNNIIVLRSVLMFLIWTRIIYLFLRLIIVGLFTLIGYLSKCIYRLNKWVFRIIAVPDNGLKKLIDKKNEQIKKLE